MASALIASGSAQPAPPLEPLASGFSGERALGSFGPSSNSPTEVRDARAPHGRPSASRPSSGQAGWRSKRTHSGGGTARRTTFRNVIGRRTGSGADLVVVGCRYDEVGHRRGLGGGPVPAPGLGSCLSWRYWGSIQTADGGPAGVLRRRGVEAYGPHDGLHGSRRLCERLRRKARRPRFRGVLIVDMIGDRDLTVTVPAERDAEADQRGVRVGA